MHLARPTRQTQDRVSRRTLAMTIYEDAYAREASIKANVAVQTKYDMWVQIRPGSKIS